MKNVKENTVNKELSVSLTVSVLIETKGANLGTLLGSCGIAVGPFNKEFKEYIEGLSGYFKGCLFINYFTDKSLEFFFNFLSTGNLLILCSQERTLYKKGVGGFVSFKVFFISLQYFLEIVYLKFKDLGEANLKQVYGCLISTELYLFKD